MENLEGDWSEIFFATNGDQVLEPADNFNVQENLLMDELEDNAFMDPETQLIGEQQIINPLEQYSDPNSIGFDVGAGQFDCFSDNANMGQNELYPTSYGPATEADPNLMQGMMNNGDNPNNFDYQYQTEVAYNGVDSQNQTMVAYDLADNQSQAMLAYNAADNQSQTMLLYDATYNQSQTMLACNAGYNYNVVDNQIRAMLMYDPAKGAIILKQGQSSIHDPINGPPDSFMLPWNPEIPLGNQLDQFSFPPVGYNSSAYPSMIPESSSTVFGSQQQTDFQLPDQGPQMSYALEPIPILANSNFQRSQVINTMSRPQYPSQGGLAPGLTSNFQAFSPGSNSSYQTFSPGSSSIYQGFTLGSNSNSGGLSIGSSSNPRESVVVPTTWTYRAPQGRNTRINAYTDLATSSSSNNLRTTWVAGATATHSGPETDSNLFRTWISEMKNQNRAYDPRRSEFALRLLMSKCKPTKGIFDENLWKR